MIELMAPVMFGTENAEDVVVAGREEEGVTLVGRPLPDSTFYRVKLQSLRVLRGGEIAVEGPVAPVAKPDPSKFAVADGIYWALWYSNRPAISSVTVDGEQFVLAWTRLTAVDGKLRWGYRQGIGLEIKNVWAGFECVPTEAVHRVALRIPVVYPNGKAHIVSWQVDVSGRYASLEARPFPGGTKYSWVVPVFVKHTDIVLEGINHGILATRFRVLDPAFFADIYHVVRLTRGLLESGADDVRDEVYEMVISAMKEVAK